MVPPVVFVGLVRCRKHLGPLPKLEFRMNDCDSVCESNQGGNQQF